MKKIYQGNISALIMFVTLTSVFFSCKKEDSYSSEPTPLAKTDQITFQKTYGGTNSEHVWDVQPTLDSGYIMIGSTSSYGAGDEDIYVVKTDAGGNTQWTKTFGGAEQDQGYYIKQTNDGGYILGGWGGSFGTFNLIKIDTKGNVQWTKVYDGIGGDDVQQTSDGGYVVAGPATGFAGIQLIKTDNMGNITWSKTYEGGNGGPLIQTNDGGYAVAGFTGIFGSGGWDFLLIKVDNTGNLLWAKTYGNPSGTDDSPVSMQQTTDGGYIITGLTNGTGAGDYDMYLVKTDAKGNLLWSKTYGGNLFDGASAVEQITGGGFILSGIANGGFSAGKIVLIKTDNNGNVVWSRLYGGGKEAYSYAHQSKDGGYIIVSETSVFGSGSSDIYLIKTDSNGNSGCHETSFAPTVTIPATQVASPSPRMYTGGTAFSPSFNVGTGGKESTLCYK